jgi:cyclase
MSRPGRRAGAAPRVEEISPGVYGYIQPDGSWWINNTGFVTGPGATLAIDSCATEARTTAYRDAIASVSPMPVRTLVNTHHHGDHTHGNYQFREATIVAHRNCRAEMLVSGLPGARIARTWAPPEWGALELEPPSLTFEDRIELWSGERHCEVRFIGTPAHTTSDSIVWLPEESVLFAGDLVFNGGTPFILGGSLDGSIEAVAALAALAPRTIVPGHGPICGPEAIDEVLGYLHFVRDLAGQALAAGLAPLEAAREADLGSYAELLDAERIVANLHRACAELQGASRGAPIDRAAALADMVSYNGGRRLDCHA